MPKTSKRIIQNFLRKGNTNNRYANAFLKYCISHRCSGGSRISKRRFPLVVDHRRRGLGAQPPATEEVLILKSMQSIESYNVLYLRPLSIMS